MTAAAQHTWWGELRHGGMLVAPQLLDELAPTVPALDTRAYERLRASWLRLDGALHGDTDPAEAARAFATELLEGFLGLSGWQKAGAVPDALKATAVTGERLRPDWVLPDGDGGALLAVRFDDADRVGIGRGKRVHARLVELLRATGVPLGLLTNGRQFRLVHAGPDYDAWAEWDAQTWFDEGEGRETLRGLAALLGAGGGGSLAAPRALVQTIRTSRDRQGDLAQVLGEQVRQAVELLVRELDHRLDADAQARDALWTDPATGRRLHEEEALGALYQAATRVVMRLVLVLYAESRDLLPAGIEAYHDSYGVEGLYRTLRDADREGADAADQKGAWVRLVGLFRLIYAGSEHPDLPVRAYGGQLFRPGDSDAPEPVLRALAVLEAARPSDATLYRLLRLLKVGKVKVRAGRGARWVAGAVDFADLRTEYIGIVYEGLLDYELRRAPTDDPIVLLDVGRQPALPLSRLRELGPAALKELLKTFKKDAKSAAGAGEEGEESAESGEEEAEDEEDDLVDEDLAEDEEPDAAEEPDAEADEADARSAVVAWAREAVQAAALVRRPGGKNPDLLAYERKVAERAAKLVGGIIPPGRLYLVASGGLRKGSGSFYTRPALSVPLVQRTLEPLCYTREDDRLVPRAPEEILGLKVCEPAMGSGSFLVAALRYLVEALHRSLDQHGRIQPRAEREVVVTLPFGTAARGEEAEELLPLAPEDERFTEHLRARLARHVVERCLYGVDRNPMAVELARLALWVETLDRDLPFEYLDHKLKVGNSLVGCWLHLVDDYPLRALDRQDADGAKGERTKWLKRAFAEAKAQMPAVIDRMGGAMRFFDDVQLPPEDLVARVRERFEALHELRREEREPAYRELLASDEYRELKRRMDLWSALWFWPAGDESLPLPLTWIEPTPEAEATVARLAGEHGFFHWEVEFADAFRPDRAGFDAVLGNPPWDVAKPNSQEFFSRHDPLYRTYGKTQALTRQASLFGAVDGLEDEWQSYQASFKAMAGLVRAVHEPWAVSLARGKAGDHLAGGWQTARASRSSLAQREHPYRLQGSADLNTYKLFLETAHHLLTEDGRLGMLLPSGVYTDKGTTALRKRFLESCSWEWCYGFENRLGLFPIHRSFKFVPVVVQRGGSTEAVNVAFMRHDVSEWERPGEHAVRLAVSDIRRFAPATWAFMELGDRDLELVERLYAEHPLLGEHVAVSDARYYREFHMTGDARRFVARRYLEEHGLLTSADDTRDPRVRAALSAAGYVPLYEGKSFGAHSPYFISRGATASVSFFLTSSTCVTRLEHDSWRRPRLLMRNIARSVDSRTLIAALMPPAVHGHSAASLVGLDTPLPYLALLNSLALDYVVRLKVSANLSWFHTETLPIPDWAATPFVQYAPDLAHRLNAVGADFDPPADDPLVEPADRLAARLTLDTLVADLFGLHPDDLAHIATRFPIYDRGAPAEHRYPALAVEVFRAMHADGPDAAQRRAQELAAVRGAADVGFGLDELWQPEGGWERANREAREILADAEAAA